MTSLKRAQSEAVPASATISSRTVSHVWTSGLRLRTLPVASDFAAPSSDQKLLSVYPWD